MTETLNSIELKINNKFLTLTYNGSIFEFELEKVSKKLQKATNIEREIFKISPSGYGIHWPLIDEDLSINALLKNLK